MKKFLFLFALMAITVTFMSCGDDNDVEPDDPGPPVPELIGTWRHTHPTEGWYDQFTFNLNNTGMYRFVDPDGIVESEGFNYSISGQILTIVWAQGGSDSITFEIIGANELYLNFGGGLALIYLRQ